MAIKIMTPAHKDEGPHNEAADTIENETLMTTTKGGEILDQKHESQSEPVMATPAYERIMVGTSFKMPVADYTMLEFSVSRSVPFNPLEKSADTVFDETKEWVEAKLNGMIEEQQGE